MHEAMNADPTGRLVCVCEHGNAARVDHQPECPYWTRLRTASPLDERLAQIQKESGDIWLQLGQKEYARRVLDAEIIQLSQKVLQLSQEADTLKKAQPSASPA